MTEPAVRRPALRLTRRGRLVRTLLALLVVIALALMVVSLVRGGGSAQAQDGDDGTASGSSPASDGGAAADAVASDGAPTAAPEAEDAESEGAEPEAETAEAADIDEDADEELVRTGTVGEGTWSVADGGGKTPEKGVVRTYAVRVEDGLGIDADEATPVELPDRTGRRAELGSLAARHADLRRPRRIPRLHGQPRGGPLPRP